MTILEAVAVVLNGVFILGWARAVWISGERRRRLAKAVKSNGALRRKLHTTRGQLASTLADLLRAEGERDAAVGEVMRMQGLPAADTVRLPRWQEFLAPPQTTYTQADYERALLEQGIADAERHANGESR